MAARRSLGGGRVLGTGKNLAPPVPPTPQASARATSPAVISPSESSVSLSSHTSSTPFSTENEDIASRVALNEHGSAQAAAAASSRMVCPICNEEMVRKAYTIMKMRQVLTRVGDAPAAEQVGTDVSAVHGSIRTRLTLP